LGRKPAMLKPRKKKKTKQQKNKVFKEWMLSREGRPPRDTGPVPTATDCTQKKTGRLCKKPKKKPQKRSSLKKTRALTPTVAPRQKDKEKSETFTFPERTRQKKTGGGDSQGGHHVVPNIWPVRLSHPGEAVA